MFYNPKAAQKPKHIVFKLNKSGACQTIEPQTEAETTQESRAAEYPTKVTEADNKQVSKPKFQLVTTRVPFKSTVPTTEPM